MNGFGLLRPPCAVALVAVLALELYRNAAADTPGCDPSKSALAAAPARLIAADNGRDLEGVLNGYTSDVTWLPPAGPAIRGTAEIRARYERLFADHRVSLQSAAQDAAAAGNLGYVVGTTYGSLTPIAGGPPVIVDDNFLALLRCEEDQWRVSHLAWSPRTAAAGKDLHLDLARASDGYRVRDLYLRQELVNDAPIGPGEPQAADHCPDGPGQWFQGSGRSEGTSNVFGGLTQTEVYCVNADRSQLTGGLATWRDSDGDAIYMTFGAKLLRGAVYAAPPHAPIIGHAEFTGGTGKWIGLSGAALLTGRQNGDGSATLEYRGTVYVPDSP